MEETSVILPTRSRCHTLSAEPVLYNRNNRIGSSGQAGTVKTGASSRAGDEGTAVNPVNPSVEVN